MKYKELETIETSDVVIIGSGASGIGAALNFLQNGYENFTIIEALDRIGGRCFTIDHGDSYLEMGAQWIHGQVGNSIFEYAAANKLLDDGHDRIELSDNDEDSNDEFAPSASAITSVIKNCISNKSEDEIAEVEFYTENGEKIPNDLALSASNALDCIIRKIEKHEIKRVDDCSFREYLIEKFDQTVLNSPKYSNESEKTKEFLKGLCNWRCNYECVDNGCSNLSCLSVKYFGSYEELKGSQAVELKYGYKAILESMINQFDSKKFYSKLRLNHGLNRVLICKQLFESNKTSDECEHCLYTSDKHKVVLVVTNNVENKNLVFICNHVICTMSLGHLKANFSKLFLNYENINLFKEKFGSIAKLGFGVVNKIYLVYEKPFWNENLVGYQLIWLNEDGKVNENNNNDWFRNIVGFETLKNHDNILCGWMYGCEYFENLSDEIVKKDCTNVLKQFLSRNDIPEPVSLIRSSWNSNPYFCGSYSHVALDSNDKDIEILAMPLPSEQLPLVNFAGEATNPKFYSTVHGAYESGKRESKRILGYLKKE